MSTRQQNVTATEYTLKNLLDLDEDDGLHVVLHHSAKFGIDSFIFQSEEQLIRHERVGDKGAVLWLQSHELGLIKQLKDFGMDLVSEDSTLDANFYCASITKEAHNQFLIGSYQPSGAHSGQNNMSFQHPAHKMTQI